MTPLTFIIPTRDRPDELARTLEAIDSYPAELLGNEPPEIIVIDNASRIPIKQTIQPRTFANTRIEIITLDENISTAARNIGARCATTEWVVMLDDDSTPTTGDFARTLNQLPNHIGAIGGEIFLPNGQREAGGLPEVIVGCGCAIRRQVFLDAGGYDETFGYYAEEYDLCAKLIAAGYTIAHTDAIRFEHRKVTAGRNFSEILFRLVRNNAWVIARHAPEAIKQSTLDAMLDRYRQIAKKESVEPAFDRAMNEIHATLSNQPTTPLTADHWRRFSGAHAAHQLALSLQSKDISEAALVAHGKGADTIARELAERSITVSDAAHTKIIATLSPGPMLDAHAQYPNAIMPWPLRKETITTP